MPSDFRIESIGLDCVDEAIEVLCEAFYDYPVMRFVIGPASTSDYPRRLAKLVGFFTHARLIKNDLVLGVYEAVYGQDRMVAVANINRPSSPPPYGESKTEDPLEEIRSECWHDLGPAARKRYEAYGEAAGRFAYPEPHFHLGLIGARRMEAGRGHARRLLESLHQRSAAHPVSQGVSLTTEIHRNLKLYEHFGYRIVGRESFGGISTWGFFRDDGRAT